MISVNLRSSWCDPLGDPQKNPETLPEAEQLNYKGYPSDSYLGSCPSASQKRAPKTPIEQKPIGRYWAQASGQLAPGLRSELDTLEVPSTTFKLLSCFRKKSLEVDHANYSP